MHPRSYRAILACSLLLFALCVASAPAQDPPPAPAPVQNFLQQAQTQLLDIGQQATMGQEGEAPASSAAPTSLALQYRVPDIAASYKAFWYSIGDDGKVIQETVDNIEYALRKTNAIKDKWIPIYTEFLQGNYDAYAENAENPISAEKAQLMVSSEMVQSLATRTDDALAKRARQMAEWALYYEQLDLWNKYVGERILERQLLPEEKIPEKAEELGTGLIPVYQAMQLGAEEMMAKETEAYTKMIDDIRDNQADQSDYEDWLQNSKERLAAYCDKYSRQFNGAEIKVNGTLFFVRNADEVPENPQDDVFKDTLPPNAILLDVPRAKLVTPFDLLDENGAIRKPDGKSGM